jgi:hypothetical protein
MHTKEELNTRELGPRLRKWPFPGKILLTMVVLMMALGMSGALAQIIVHDIIPTIYQKEGPREPAPQEMTKPDATRGDLFADAPTKKAETPFYKTDEFIFALKFTHIHIFGMSAIFILMGTAVLFLDMGATRRSWLIGLPFVGIIIDLASVWLKIFVHPAFFWLHIPGGLLFGIIFFLETVLIMQQMWIMPSSERV